jgi:broad specificity phosphatase PhoE
MVRRAQITHTTRWWWVRHAPVAESAHAFVYGQDDLPAVIEDRAPFAALAADLPRDAVWVTSHLQRTRQTAEAIFRAGYPAREALVEPGLAEQHFGEWQGRLRADFAEPRNESPHPLWLVGAHVKPPGGESLDEVLVRVVEVMDRLTNDHLGLDVIAVAHGGSIRAGLAHALGITAERVLAFRIGNLSLTTMHHVRRADDSRNWCVETVNLSPWRR